MATEVTAAFLDSGRTGSGGWNAEQLHLLGIQWPPKTGWRRRVLGKQISDANAALFLELRGKSKQERRAMKAQRKALAIGDPAAGCHVELVAGW